MGRPDEIGVNLRSGEMVLNLVETEAGNLALEQGLALGKPVLDVLGVAARSERLTMPVLLVADSARSDTRRAFWVFRVALCRN